MSSRSARAVVAFCLLLHAVPAQAEEACDEPASSLDPPAAHVLFDGTEDYRPLLTFDVAPKCMRVALPLSASLRGDVVSPIQIGADDPWPTTRSLSPRFRAGGRFDSGRAWLPFVFHAEYEHDLSTGTVRKDTPLHATLSGIDYTGDEGLDHELRKAFLRFSFARFAHLSVGWNTSHWGLGLVANDGAHGWEPGSGRLADPRSGDRVLRAQIATGPHTDAGLFAAVSGDVLDNDLLADDDVLLPGDTAQQISLAGMVGRGHLNGGGLYGVARHQESSDGSATDVFVIDFHLRTGVELDGVKLALEGELAVVTGTTELAPSTDFPQHDVLQVGGAVRGELDAGAVASVFDLLYASGDRNIDDATQHAFKADPNFEVGLLLFNHVLANQSARSAFTAGDPNIVGFPANDLERLPTRGSVTNTLVFFPRLRLRPLAGLEIYLGPLFAVAAQPLVDPFNTRVAGGAPRNVFGAEGGRYLGTEFDGGIRYRVNLAGSEVTVGLEGGAFRPGSALRLEDGTDMNTVEGARFMLDARL